MLFLIKYFLRHALFFAFITILAEASLGLYTQRQQAPATFWPTFFTHFCNQLNFILERIASLQFHKFFVVSWIKQVFDSKPHYLFLTLLSIIIYFKLRSKTLESTLVYNQKKTEKKYKEDIKENTKRELKLLEPKLAKYYEEQDKIKEQDKIRMKMQNRVAKSGDEVEEELREKENQLF